MAQEYQGLLSGFGLPEETPAQIMERKKRARLTQGQNQAQALTQGGRPYQALGHSAGSLLGGILAQRMGGTERDAASPEVRQAVMVEEARNKFDNMSNTPEFRGMTVQQKALAFQDILANSAMEAGFTDRAGAIAQATHAQRLKVAKGETELSKLQQDVTKGSIDIGQQRREAYRDSVYGDAKMEQDVAKGKLGIQKAKAALAQKGGEYKDVYIGDDANPVAAYVDPESMSVIGPDGQELQPGEFSFTAPEGAESFDAMAAKSVGDRAKVLKTMMSPTQQGAIRDSAVALERQARASNEVMGILGNLYTETGQLNVMDGAGGIIATSRKLLDGVGALTREFGSNLNVPIRMGDGKEVTRKEYAASITETDIEDLVGKDYLRASGRSAAEMKSVVVTLAYAKARANEPGNTRLSDTDFKNALQEVGAAVSDPETMRRIFRRNITDGRRAFEMQRATIPKWGEDLVITPRASARLQLALDEFDELSELPEGQSFGTAAEPSESFGNVSKIRAAQEERRKRDAAQSQVQDDHKDPVVNQAQPTPSPEWQEEFDSLY